MVACAYKYANRGIELCKAFVFHSFSFWPTYTPNFPQKPKMQSAAPASAPASAVAFLSRKDFPNDFVFGTGSSAFQYEGAPERHGKGPSIWDTFMLERHPDIVVNERALDAIHFFDRHKADVKIMKQMGFDAFRFSISWPRILPNGRWTKGPNGEEHGVSKSGIAFYNNLINELINNGIEPVVTLFHWDLPQTLETEYKGFLNDKVVHDFCNFADLCFWKFGDRVKKWTTFNETWSFSMGGYLMGIMAPGRGEGISIARAIADALPPCRATSKKNFENLVEVPQEGNPYEEIYIVTHNQLLAHAAAVKLYREKYQKHQNGQIGIAIVSAWFVPFSDKQEDSDAADRALDFMLGWLLDPLTFGDYPKSMRTLVGNRLPHFSPQQAKDLKGSFDFIGLNYYTASYAQNIPTRTRISWNLDSNVDSTSYRDGKPIGWQVYPDGACSYPQGLTDLLLLVKHKYNNPPLYITENGTAELRNDELSLWESFNDYWRIRYHYEHLSAVKCAMSQGANVKGYFAWSLMDNLEWGSGFDTRFGINFIHYGDNYERFPKLSAGWFQFLLEKEPKN